MRRSIVIAGVLVLIALVATGGISLFAPFTTDDVAPQHDREPELVHPNGSDSGFYPYLNAQPRFTQRSPVNIIIHGNTSRVVQILREETATQWNETREDEQDIGGSAIITGENETLANGTVVNESVAANRSDVDESFVNGSRVNATDNESRAGVANATADNATAANGSANESANESFIDRIDPTTAWGRTTGATRWAYVDPGPNQSGEWVQETMQVHYGEYFGSRLHIRIYGGPNESEEWVFMQAHKEHYDWFTLRHRVDSSEQAQSYVEQEFMGQPFVEEDGVYRIYLGNGGPSDSDGWATVIELAYLVPFVLGLGQSSLGRSVRSRLHEIDLGNIDEVRERTTVRHIVLPLVIVTLLLGVRYGGIFLENNAPMLTMHAIAALLYPVMSLGIPIATYLIASGIERQYDAAVIASTALSVGIWLDYAYLGIATLPVEVVLQRIIVILALGLIAGGAARQGVRETHSRWNDMLVGGVVLWVVVLAGTLLGYF
ncbi:hypothetical protein G9464_18945 [Halostella sp. JP-L12]|uniref:hypothetical protein n=1 Tax=Halostella TaxID=1843185 RepID=UPI000EF784DA|nr:MULTISPECIES: hypothetical protein [Halostella]NHN49650.1 hypothetical protein [Halostella sp. JP-L12]